MNTKNFFLLLDSDAVSVCSYKLENNKTEKSVVNKKTLEQLIGYANNFEYIISFVHGGELPKEYYRILSMCKNQTNIMGPEVFDNHYNLPNVTVSVDANNTSSLDKRKMSQDLNRSAIIHFNHSNIDELYNAIAFMLRVSRRISVVCDDNSYFQGELREHYKTELNKIARLLQSEIQLGKLTEINVLTDSVLVVDSNQCPAGSKSFSFSIDGKLYPCPAFIGMSEWEMPFSFESDFQSKTDSVFSFRPICGNCANKQCRQCAYTNYIYTKEICIPPYEMCEIAALEKQISGSVLSKQSNKNVSA